MALSTGVEFVELDDAEAGRIYHFMNAECYARLEFFNLLPDDWSREQYWHDVGRLDDKSPSTEAADHALRVVDHIVALYTLVARDPLRPLAVNVDRFDGSRWVREDHLEVMTAVPSWSEIVSSRFATWSSLIEHWPLGDRVLDQVLQTYHQSVNYRRSRHLVSSIMHASAATEVLLGAHTEITYRMSNRGAHLVGSGEGALKVAAELRRLYGVRSAATHGGKQPARADCDSWHQFLMAALPAAKAYGQPLDTLKQDLDRACFVRSDEVERLRTPGWWSYCDFVDCLQRRPAP